MRVPGEVDSHAVGGAEAGTFPDEDDGEGGLEEFADFVSDCDSALLADYGLGGGQEFEELRGVLFYGEGGEAVADYVDCVGFKRCEAGFRFGVELTA
jgi:hypothetical protein